eukprot:gnl/MRDRNA2_/MRDRNA2_68996_c0_seq2.p1 gnl/MRDRNA2_/MRDRNA2_68996_c0~~gnl/MRDRNA2_/MRDRNA2_68996_c0_seq2.p1  ORF type:complete len:144 (-),score=12.66 gnl/MRDRNA2_/MRDRNA2_68996_c0_seq2:78-461(-)
MVVSMHQRHHLSPVLKDSLPSDSESSVATSVAVSTTVSTAVGEAECCAGPRMVHKPKSSNWSSHDSPALIALRQRSSQRVGNTARMPILENRTSERPEGLPPLKLSRGPLEYDQAKDRDDCDTCIVM